MKNTHTTKRTSMLFPAMLTGIALITGICIYTHSNTRQYHTGISVADHDNNSEAAGMAQYFFNARKNPNTGQMDYAAMASSEAAVASFNSSAMRYHKTMSSNYGLSWNFLGPDNVGGRTRAILIDKNDPSGNTIFAGGVSGGIWKSTDAGATWNNINDTMASLEVSCIAQDASGNIYIGTGEGFSVYSTGDGFSAGMIGRGIFKSTDDGASFTQLASTVPIKADTNSLSSAWAYVNRIAICPCNPSIIYAAIYGGLMVSPDGGNTWHYAYNSVTKKQLNIPATFGGDVKISEDGSVVVADVNGTGYISYPNCTNMAGEFDTSFTKIPGGVGGIATGNRIEFAISPTNSNYIYCSVAVNSGTPGKGFVGIYMTMNQGKYWYLIGPGGSVLFDPYTEGGGGAPDQATYDNAMAVSPANPGTLLAGGTTLWQWQQTNASDTVGGWNNLTTYGSSYFVYGGGDPTYIHPDEHTIVFNLNKPNIVYLGCDGGIFESSTSGITWQPMNRNYDVTQFYAIEAAPYVNTSNAEGTIGGTQDNGTPYIDGTATPYYQDAIDMSGGDGGDAKISYLNPNVFFTSIDNCTFLARGSNLSGHAGPGPFYNKTVGLNKGANIDSIATSGGGCFVQPLALYENMFDTNTVDSLRWVASDSATAGTTVYPVSPNGNVSFAYKLPKSVVPGDTLMIKNTVVGKIATGFYASNGVWMCMQEADLADAAIWMPIGSPKSQPDAFTGADPVHCLAWSPTGNELFVGTEGGQLFRFSNLNAVRDTSYTEGATFSIAKGAAGTEVTNAKCIVVSKNMNNFGRDILSISVDPYDGNHILVTLGNYVGTNQTYVYYSSNALAATPTFTNVSGNLPPMPVYSSILNILGTKDSLSALIGTEHGVWSTTNVTKKKWSLENTGAANTLVMGMKQQTLPTWLCNNSGNIYIGTHGRGAWYTGTIGPLSVQNVNAPSQAATTLKVYPNPMNAEGTVQFTLTKEENLTLTVYDMLGKAVKTEVHNLGAGEHLLSLNTSDLSTGTYIVTLTGDNYRQTTRIVVAR